MISILQIRYAIIILRDHETTTEDVVNQIAESLSIYLNRGEYHHNNLNEAVQCLKLAGYEIDVDQ